MSYDSTTTIKTFAVKISASNCYANILVSDFYRFQTTFIQSHLVSEKLLRPFPSEALMLWLICADNQSNPRWICSTAVYHPSGYRRGNETFSLFKINILQRTAKTECNLHDQAYCCQTAKGPRRSQGPRARGLEPGALSQGPWARGLWPGSL